MALSSGSGVDSIGAPRVSRGAIPGQPIGMDLISQAAGSLEIADKTLAQPDTPSLSSTGGVEAASVKSAPAAKVDSTYSKASTAIAGAKFVADVSNAQSAYASITGQAQLNIMQARNKAADASFRGRQAQLDRQSEGESNANKSLLSAAAQGQDLSGAGASKVAESFKAIGVMNGMREEINGIREALGYKLEEVNYDYQISQAKIARDNALIGSALNFGASFAGKGGK